MSKSYISPTFRSKITEITELRLFQVLFSTYSGPLSSITDEIFQNQLLLNPIETVDTHIKDEIITVGIFNNNIRNYTTLFFMYNEGTSENNLAFAIKLKNNEYGGLELEDYTENIIHFDLRSFNLKCKFLPILDIQYSPIHNHKSSSIDSVSTDPLINFNELNSNYINEYLSNTEISSSQLDEPTESIQFKLNGSVKNGSSYLLNPLGNEVFNQINEQVNLYNKITQEDIL